MISLLGLGLTAPNTPKSQTPQVATTAITVNAFSRDKTLFDRGAAFGRNIAAVPVSGTATPGEAVELRLLPSSGAPGAWAQVATADAQGNWSATLNQPASSDWQRVEVRIQSEPFVRASGANRFGVGTVFALWGQSEVVRIRSQAHDNIAHPALLADDMVQALWFDGAPVVKHLSDGDAHTAALAALANTLIETQPGEKFAVVFQAVSGTGFRQLVNDADPGRDWADDAALHGFATADGQHVGLSAVSWFATPGVLAEHYGEAVLPLFTGKTMAGDTVSFPGVISYGTGDSYQADHWFGELYDPAHSKWVAYGPHRFDIEADMLNATVLADGTPQANLANKQQSRESWREMLSNPDAAALFVESGLEPLTYQNGVSDGAGGWTDISHPAGNSPDGSSALARLTAHAVLRGAGMTNWQAPAFDQCAWQPDGSYVEVWCSAGPVTTPRQARGEVALDNSHAHWTNVLGWQINDAPAQRAEVVAGRVRIYPNTAPFIASDVIRYGEGGATGMIKFPEDAIAQTWKDLPVVDLGLAGLNGVPVRPLPDEALLANTILPTQASFTTAATGPYFCDPLELGAGLSAMTFHARLTPVFPPSGSTILLTTTGNYLRLEILPNGKLRLRIRDEGGAVLVDYVQTASGVVADGVLADITLSFDLVAGWARLWEDGALLLDLSFTSSAPAIPSVRKLSLMAVSTGTNQTMGEVEALSVWKEATFDGGLPIATPYKALTGPASSVNADAWKKGDDAV